MTSMHIGGSLSEPPSSKGPFEMLPLYIVSDIFSMAPGSKVSLVSKGMRDLWVQVLRQQLLDKGLSAAELTQKWGMPVDIRCVVLLLPYLAHFEGIALKTKEVALDKLSLVIGAHYELLQNPNELRQFLVDLCACQAY